MNKEIEIPFGAKDSELKGWEYTIPEGMEAEIKDGKIIVREKESEDERIREAIESIIRVYGKTQGEWIGGYDVDTLIVNLRRAFNKKEQKPAEWSEEDEGMLNCIIATLCEESHGGREANDKMVVWLENRFRILRPQPKQEWSEEDEEMLNNIIWSVHMKSIIKPLYEMDDRSRYKKYEDFLKALPERFNLQPNWKPSEEQMKALEDAFRKDGGNEYRKVINSLYYDLQKLL